MMKQLSNSVKVSAMKAGHYDAVYALWQQCSGVRLTESDSREQVIRYLKRNKNLSTVAICGGEVVGAMLCGHDGMKGFIHHIAVDQRYRRSGVGRQLVERSLKLLQKEGIALCQIVVSSANQQGQRFWQELGWEKRDSYLFLTEQQEQVERSVWELELPNLLPIAA